MKKATNTITTVQNIKVKNFISPLWIAGYFSCIRLYQAASRFSFKTKIDMIAHTIANHLKKFTNSRMPDISLITTIT